MSANDYYFVYSTSGKIRYFYQKDNNKRILLKDLDKKIVKGIKERKSTGKASNYYKVKTTCSPRYYYYGGGVPVRVSKKSIDESIIKKVKTIPKTQHKSNKRNSIKKSPVKKTKSSTKKVSTKKTPIKKTKSSTKKTKSPVKKTKSPVKKTKSPVKKTSSVSKSPIKKISSPIQTLPNDMLSSICQMSSIDDITKCCSMNKSLQNTCSTKAFWVPIFKRFHVKLDEGVKIDTIKSGLNLLVKKVSRTYRSKPFDDMIKLCKASPIMEKACSSRSFWEPIYKRYNIEPTIHHFLPSQSSFGERVEYFINGMIFKDFGFLDAKTIYVEAAKTLEIIQEKGVTSEGINEYLEDVGPGDWFPGKHIFAYLKHRGFIVIKGKKFFLTRKGIAKVRGERKSSDFELWVI